MGNPVDAFDPNRFIVNDRSALCQPRSRKQRVDRQKPFIRGPIDLFWLAEARKLGVTPLWLALGLWYLKGLRKADTFVLSNRQVSEWGIEPDAKSRALRKLEAAGLVSVERRERRSPLVTILANIPTMSG